MTIFDPAGTLTRTFRSLRRAPGFVAIATLSLGTALGLSTASFALIDAITHPVSALQDVDQLLAISIWSSPRRVPTAPEYESALAALPPVERVATYESLPRTVVIGEDASQLSVVATRPGFFELVGAHPRLGRFPTEAEVDQESAVLVSDRIWRAQFRNPASVDGATLYLDDRSYNVVGVLRDGSNAPNPRVDVWLPVKETPSTRMGNAIIRLRPGATRDMVRPLLVTMFQQFDRVFMEPRGYQFRHGTSTLRADPLQIQDYHRAMVGASLCVLLIACGNVAALMLARGVVRRREYALQLALGSSRRRIAASVLTEVALLAVLGCIVGFALALAGTGLMTSAMPQAISWVGIRPPQWSPRVFGWSALAVTLSILVAGGFPAWRAATIDPAGPLKEGAGAITGRFSTRFRWLVMAELAVSMMLLMGSSLMFKSVRNLLGYDFGFDQESIVRAGVNYFEPWRSRNPDSLTRADRIRLTTGSFEKVRTTRGVRSAATMSPGPCYRVITTEFVRDDTSFVHMAGGNCYFVSTDFFRTIGTTVIDGRDFTEGDYLDGRAVILDAKAAHRLFGARSPVGHVFKFGLASENRPWFRVVGVVPEMSLSFRPNPEVGRDLTFNVFVAGGDLGRHYNEFVVRPEKGVAHLPVILLRNLRDVNPAPPRAIARAGPWEPGYAERLKAANYLTIVFGVLGVASLVLGAAGLFAVVSYIAGQRMREFAVRISLGATRENVIRLVMRTGFELAIGGTAFGAPLGMWAGFALWQLLYNLFPVDAGALIVAEAILLGVTLGACMVPALRASRADPLEIIRAA